MSDNDMRFVGTARFCIHGAYNCEDCYFMLLDEVDQKYLWSDKVHGWYVDIDYE